MNSSDEEMMESNYRASLADGSPRSSTLSKSLKNLNDSPNPFTVANDVFQS
jgi:hypothetical protein